jgi:hypothetical protein
MTKSSKQVAAIKEKSSKTKGGPTPIRMPASENESVRIEKISNGYLSHHNRDTKDGYQHTTIFHPTKPQLMTATPAVPRKKG